MSNRLSCLVHMSHIKRVWVKDFPTVRKTQVPCCIPKKSSSALIFQTPEAPERRVVRRGIRGLPPRPPPGRHLECDAGIVGSGAELEALEQQVCGGDVLYHVEVEEPFLGGGPVDGVRGAEEVEAGGVVSFPIISIDIPTVLDAGRRFPADARNRSRGDDHLPYRIHDAGP